MKNIFHFRILVFLLIIPFPLIAQWVQKGVAINGASSYHLSGRAVSLNGDGNILVIGSPGEGSVSSYEGSGRVFRWDGVSWQQKGSTVYGEHPLDQFGNSVSINEAGSIIAIGALFNDDNGMNAGLVRVYEWNGVDWLQLGADIDGLSAEDGSNIVSLNADGNIVAIGAPHYSFNGDTGYVRVFEWISGNWNQLGATIYGEAAGDLSGLRVSLNNEGNELAIGAPANDGNGSNAGHVRIYAWDGSAWIQKGNDIDGEYALDNSGWSVSLSGDGNTVSIGAPGNSEVASNAGHARIFSFDGSDWVQKGADINGYVADDLSGSSIGLSDGGDTVAIGAWEEIGIPIGYVHIFNWNGSSWTQVGNKITANCCGVAESIGLNNRGNVVAIGAYLHNGGGIGSGQVTVWSDITVGVSEINDNSMITIFPNPSVDEITINLNQKFESITVTIKNNIGQILSSETFYDVIKIQHDFKLVPGYYFAEISSDQAYIAITRFLKM